LHSLLLLSKSKPRLGLGSGVRFLRLPLTPPTDLCLNIPTQVLFALLLLYLIFTAMDIWHTHKVWWLCGRRGVGVQHPPVL